jgi:hypothetical protein
MRGVTQECADEPKVSAAFGRQPKEVLGIGEEDAHATDLGKKARARAAWIAKHANDVKAAIDQNGDKGPPSFGDPSGRGINAQLAGRRRIRPAPETLTENKAHAMRQNLHGLRSAMEQHKPAPVDERRSPIAEALGERACRTCLLALSRRPAETNE